MRNGSEHLEERTWLQPDDRVRLTGESWDHFEMRGQTARVVDIDLNGDPLIEDPVGGLLAVFTKPAAGIDYSAEMIEEKTDD